MNSKTQEIHTFLEKIRKVSKRNLLHAALFISGLIWILSCNRLEENEGPRLVGTSDFFLGSSPEFRAEGLNPGGHYTIDAELTDTYGRNWISTAVFKADAHGGVDISRDAPIDGDYEGVDSFGLLWSMHMPSPPGKDWQAPEPKDYNQIVFNLATDGRILSKFEVRQWVQSSDVKHERLNGNLVAELFLPGDNGSPRPGLILLGGSGGGMG